MRRERDKYWAQAGGRYAHTMPTFLIKNYFNSESRLQLTGPEMFKAMNNLRAQGEVIKHKSSRIGQAYWQLADKETPKE
jgi:hypothetical protein